MLMRYISMATLKQAKDFTFTLCVGSFKSIELKMFLSLRPVFTWDGRCWVVVEEGAGKPLL